MTQIKVKVAECNKKLAENAIRFYLKDAAIDIQPKSGDWTIVEFLSQFNLAFPKLKGGDFIDEITGNVYTLPDLYLAIDDTADTLDYYLTDNKRVFAQVGSAAYEKLKNYFK